MFGRKRTWVLATFLLAVFLFFLLFFTRAHPILPSNMDDWAYLYPHRSAVPIWKGWNPIRIFAEVGIPAVSMISSFLFMPFTGNIFTALMIGFAISVSMALTGLLLGFCRLLANRTLSDRQVIAWGVFFLLCHFWIFRTEYQGNYYMLWTSDACTYFFYVIPNLMNAAAVLWLETDPELRALPSAGAYGKKALFLLLAYFSIFSNIWASMILAAYVGSRLLFSVAALIRKEKTGKAWLSENATLLLLAAVWLVSQIFELNGMRAGEIGRNMGTELSRTLSTGLSVLLKMNRRYALTMPVLLAGGLTVMIRSKDRQELRSVVILAVAGVFCLLYLVLSCSKTGASYIRRPDVFYGLFFFGTVTVILAASALIRRVPVLKLILPLTLVIILVDCQSPGRTWREANGQQLSPRIINNINNDIVKQLKAAEAEGKNSVQILLPDFGVPGNWPYSVEAGEVVGETMWKLGVLEKNIIVEAMIPTAEKNSLLQTGPDG